MDVVAAFFGVGGRIVETMGGLELDSRFEFVHDDVSSVGELEVIICYASAVVNSSDSLITIPMASVVTPSLL